MSLSTTPGYWPAVQALGSHVGHLDQIPPGHLVDSAHITGQFERVPTSRPHDDRRASPVNRAVFLSMVDQDEPAGIWSSAQHADPRACTAANTQVSSTSSSSTPHTHRARPSGNYGTKSATSPRWAVLTKLQQLAANLTAIRRNAMTTNVICPRCAFDTIEHSTPLRYPCVEYCNASMPVLLAHCEPAREPTATSTPTSSK